MLFTEPFAGPAPVIRFINKARGHLFMNCYYFNDFNPAIRAAVRRGVVVRVMVDPRPYRISRRLVETEIARLRRDGAHVVMPPARFTGAYRFDHAKYMVTNSAALVSTANFDWSAFHRNREYIDITRNPATVRVLDTVFNADAGNRPAGLSCRQISQAALTVTPGPAGCSGRDILARLISRNDPVRVETEELPDDSPVLGDLEHAGSRAEIVIPPPSRAGLAAVRRLRAAGVRLRVLPRRPLYMHAKMIEAGRLTWIGSNNLSPTSLTRNREIGIFVESPGQRRALRSTFQADFQRAGE